MPQVKRRLIVNPNVVWCALLLCSGWLYAIEPIDIPSGQRQLFLDDYVIGELQGLKRTLHSPKKRGAVIRGAKPWQTLQIRTAPVWDAEAKVYKIWLISTDRPFWTSADGLNWSPGPVPNLATAHVVYDPNDPDPQRRFKGAQTNEYFATSPDGVTWTKLLVGKVPSSDESNLSYDPKQKLFIHSVKRGGKYGRALAIAVSRDFENWDDYGVVFQSDDEDQERGKTTIRQRVADPTLMPMAYVDEQVFRVDVYNMGVFHYEGQYIGLPAIFHATGPVPNYPNTDGFQVIQLAVSRDLKTWQRVADRAVFIGPSKIDSGAYDLTQILPPSAPIERDDQLWFYYTGLKYRSTFFYEGTYPDGKTIDKPGLDQDRGAVCLAVLRKDGFVSLDPIAEEGTLITKPIELPGEKLFLNLQCTEAGSAVVEVLDETEGVLAASEPLKGDGIRLPVSWQSGTDWKPSKDQSVRLRVRLAKCALYAFEVSE
ncbi:MAG: hypothetical protein KDA68_01235 [Planctomycetaceae bacterium]|nr:hypothetical protein [Planctomycetaceae bacterium]